MLLHFFGFFGFQKPFGKPPTRSGRSLITK
uniref:Uncharacterized protein n=1 Tax=Heterorhabditis bacteriophora TaxID=37862 RepID=A0A1I7WD01_HETBA